MSLRDLNPATRRRLRRHAWMLTTWCVAVGLATSWLLLHAFGLGRPAFRFGIVAIAIYALGLVVGARIWLVHFSQSVAADRELGVAAPGDSEAFDVAPAPRVRSANRTGSDGGFDLSDAFDWFSFDEGALLLIVPALIIAAVSFLLASGGGSLMILDSLAGLLAEVAIQFVFGALIARRVMRPSAHDAAFMTIVGKTWLAGAAFVVLSMAAGWLLEWINPGGASVRDLFR